jgi:hypothetical protein
MIDLLESQRLRPAAVVQYNLGLAYRGLGRYRDAIATFRAYLVAPDRAADASRTAAVRAEIDELARRLVPLRVDLRPADATVVVDGRVERAERDVLTLDPGLHTVEVSAEGFRAFR